jgi:hypothetical protein
MNATVQALRAVPELQSALTAWVCSPVAIPFHILIPYLGLLFNLPHPYPALFEIFISIWGKQRII